MLSKKSTRPKLIPYPQNKPKNTQQNQHNNQNKKQNNILGQLQKIYYVVQLHIYLTEFSTFINLGVLDTLNKSQRHGCCDMITFYYQDGHHMVDLTNSVPTYGTSYENTDLPDLKEAYGLSDDAVEILEYCIKNNRETSIELD